MLVSLWQPLTLVVRADLEHNLASSSLSWAPMAGKSTLLGTILGTPTHRRKADVNARIGYIPQQRMFAQQLPLRHVIWCHCRWHTGSSESEGRLKRKSMSFWPKSAPKELQIAGLVNFPAGSSSCTSGAALPMIRRYLPMNPALADPARQAMTIDRLQTPPRQGHRDHFCHPRHQPSARRRLPGAVSRAARTYAGFGGRSHAHRGALGALRRKRQSIKR